MTQKRMIECFEIALKASISGIYPERNGVDAAYWIDRLGGLAGVW